MCKFTKKKKVQQTFAMGHAKGYSRFPNSRANYFTIKTTRLLTESQRNKFEHTKERKNADWKWLTKDFLSQLKLQFTMWPSLIGEPLWDSISLFLYYFEVLSNWMLRSEYATEN